MQLPDSYDHRQTEPKRYRTWQDGGYLNADAQSEAPAYTILMPPPNVTSQLHMGHGTGYSIQDILIRWRRMCGDNACWLPGTDHAGIATQMMVEKSLEAQGIGKADLGREAFFRRCQEWKDKYGGAILEQFKSLGYSCDWSRLSYTMDPHLSKAVRHVFVRLFEEGLIYRGERLVNWDPVLKTAISDDEIENTEITGSIWTFLYPVEGSDQKVPIATTRPETMFGDMAVAVHPEDERYQSLVGKHVVLPFVGRRIPIIADDYVKSEFGTGAVKITPAHDPNDFQIGKRHDLEFLNIMNDDATLNGHVPEAFRGLDRYDARKLVIREMKALELFVEEKAHKHAAPHSERSKSIIEPRLSKQWYVKMASLAKPAADAAREKKIRFYPPAWEKTYLYWLDNIQDWCISRQLWWGHRIPIWYCQACESPTTGMDDPTSCPTCGKEDLRQDEDVLDTWFSSWLWPLSPFGWPDSPNELAQFYPSAVLVTAPEIIYLWVARMIMVGLKMKGEVPFKDVYFNATVCDKKGRKFSKTLGNGIDPLEVVEAYGADAVRFTAVSLAPLGGRVRMDKKDFEHGARFVHKLWNASKFLLSHLEEGTTVPAIDEKALSLPERWLLATLNETAANVNRLMETYRLNDAVDAIYQYIWGALCDWGIECAKEPLKEGNQNTLSVLVYALEGALRLASPVMPFVTEEIWEVLPVHPQAPRGKALMVSDYPKGGQMSHLASDRELWSWVMEVITTIRSIRQQSGISPGERLRCHIIADDELTRALTECRRDVTKLAGLSEISTLTVEGGCNLVGVGRGYEVHIPADGLIDVAAEHRRLSNEIARIQKILGGLEKKLANKQFTDRAPEDVIASTKDQAENLRTQLTHLQRNVDSLSK